MSRTRLTLAAALVVVLGGAGAALGALAPDGPPTGARGTTLGQAAGQPHGVGARDVSPSGSAHVDPLAADSAPSLAQRHAGHGSAVAPAEGVAAPLTGRTDRAGRAVSVSGCLLDYGGGDACLPAVPPAAAAMGMDEVTMPWTCADVRALHRQGIRVTGTDALGLDTDRDGTACGPADASAAPAHH